MNIIVNDYMSRKLINDIILSQDINIIDPITDLPFNFREKILIQLPCVNLSFN